MPESVTDRPTRAHEYIFVLTKRERYFWDAQAVSGAERDLSEMRQDQRKAGRMQRNVCKVRTCGDTDDVGTGRPTATRQPQPALGLDHRHAALRRARTSPRSQKPWSNAACWPARRRRRARLRRAVGAGGGAGKRRPGDSRQRDDCKATLANRWSASRPVTVTGGAFVYANGYPTITAMGSPTCRCPDTTGSAACVVSIPSAASRHGRQGGDQA